MYGSLEVEGDRGARVPPMMMTHTMRKDQAMMQLFQSRIETNTKQSPQDNRTRPQFVRPDPIDGSRYDFMIWEYQPADAAEVVPSTRLLDGAPMNVVATPKYGIDPKTVPADLYAKYQAKQVYYERIRNVRDKTNGWDDVGKVEEMDVWIKIDGDFLMIHCELNLDIKLDLGVKYFLDCKFRSTYDEKVKHMLQLQQITPNLELVQVHNKGSWPISERDCLFYRFGTYTDKDTYQIVGFDAEDAYKDFPAGKGVVRIAFDMFGCLVTRLTDKSCRIEITSRVNPRVSVPKFLVKGKLKDKAEVYWKFKKAVEKAEGVSPQKK